MDYYLVNYNSINTAAKIKNYFKYDGDYLTVIQTPSSIAFNGCSYSVRVRGNKLNDVIRASDMTHSQILSIFRVNINGSYTKIR